MTRTKTLATISLFAALAVPGLAHAQRHNPLEGQPPVRHKKELRAGRFFVEGYTGSSLVSDFKNTYLAGAGAEYYITDWLSIGGTGAVGFNQNTGLTNELAGLLPPTPPSQPSCSMTGMFDCGTPSVSQFYQHMNQIAWLGDVHAGYTPIFGKIGIAQSIFADYDLELVGGLGFINFTNGFVQMGAPNPQDPRTQNPDNAGTRVGPALGINLHFFINDWIALDIGFKDIIVQDNPGGLDTNYDRAIGNDDLSLQNKLFATFGLAFYLPPSVEISP